MAWPIHELEVWDRSYYERIWHGTTSLIRKAAEAASAIQSRGALTLG